jgi:TM2 domain-containing membrane protein YozV
MPNLDEMELRYVQDLVKDMTDNQIQQFSIIYNSKRRDPQLILILTLIGFLGFAGVQRFLTDQIGMGILYFFTAGLCFIGTIVDLVNYKSLASEYNMKMARQAAAMTMASS